MRQINRHGTALASNTTHGDGEMSGYKRGDGVVFIRTSRVTMIGQDSYDREDIEVGKVVSVTRDGDIKAYVAKYGTRVILANTVYKYAQQYRLPADSWDIEAVMEYAGNRPWSHNPQHKGMPFESLERCRQELKQFRLLVGSPGQS